MTDSNRDLDRRTVVGAVVSCAAHLSFAGPWWSRFDRRGGPARSGVEVQQPWARLERLADGVWALVSTPLDGDRTTLCNGGIIAGRDGVLIVEAFASVMGAAWMAGIAQGLTGQRPTHVVLTHFHGDHTGGIGGFGRTAAGTLRVTATTRDLVLEQDGRQPPADVDLRASLLAGAVVLRPDLSTTVDLGGRVVHLIPRGGHTPSDVTIELDDPGVVFCGDLVWNRMFPNYRDAIPSALSDAVRTLRRPEGGVYVPGHGPLATMADLDRYIALIDDVERHARRAIEAGTPIADAAARYRVPDALGEWLRFSDRYFEVAFRSWERELSP